MATCQQDSPMQRSVCVPGEGRVKLRSSCDACSAAKVKCDSQVPCERCRDNAVHCFYSPSRRHGKQPWAKRVASQHQRLQSTMHVHPSQAPSMGSFLAFQPNPGGGTFTMPSVLPPGVPTSQMNSTPFVNGPADGTSADHSFNVTNNLQFQDPWLGVSASAAPAHSSSPASTSTLTMSEASMSPLLEPAFQPPVHDCEAKALAMLHSLHMKSAEHPTSGTHSSQQLPPLDKILHTNRMAVSTLGDLLQCHCAQQPHLALLYMATISKALFWYRLAINLSFKSSTQLHGVRHEPLSPQSHTGPFSMSPGPNTTTSATNTMSNQIKEIPRGRARSNTIQIGSFDLEEEDEAILVRSVVVTEVKKVARLVDFMRSGGIQTNITKEHGEDSLSVGSWYRAGGEKLDREVQDTLQEARGSGRIATNFDPYAGGSEQMWSA
ncbi:hypothetical protein DPSP01_012708 [Paraphaeosphaeria sporulosa]|uniref:Zn(2)-C6 fungal-type domain-containing protein n=1 Tax=Paraphaeosphaeria sporulosa TaxID=1460663 RepID=A0A177C8L5_9PLEO|nr:uncharacterized protein CC84DRAFT_1207928 [Paraphaeosphaeria sporulosa]OAG03202.1 hypothetical protein CC84DRAFT_1207928 [Paraphaeosphaeria sporulosa]